ncbi:MAG: TRAP transporter small permease [Lachnospiraceae bacterium]|nr:TRAP transporter small permease [Lachnospiraceae bacterium]
MSQETLLKIKGFYDWIYKIFLFICKLLLVADILVVSLTVLGRYVPFIPDPTWTEEITLTLMSYMAVLSAALAIRRGAHIRMTSFDRYLPNVVINVLDVLADIGVMILAVIMLVVGWKYATGIGAKGFYPSLPWLSKQVMYMPIPIAGIAMIIFEAESLFNNVLKLMGKEPILEKEESLEEQVAEGGV